MAKVIKSSGKEIRLVQEVATQVLNNFKKFINLDVFGEEPAHETMNLKKLGGGACGKVFDFGDYVIKVNGGGAGWGGFRDGKVMESLQGLPLVPNLYAYTADEKYYLIQKVKGKVVGDYLGWGTNNKLPAPFPLETWTEKLERFYEGAKERGWIPNDCHDYNSMLDEKGNFWVVDFGLFRDARDYDGNGDYFDLVNQIEALACKSENELQKEAV